MRRARVHARNCADCKALLAKAMADPGWTEDWRDYQVCYVGLWMQDHDRMEGKVDRVLSVVRWLFWLAVGLAVGWMVRR